MYHRHQGGDAVAINMLCYERHVPELRRILMQKIVELYRKYPVTFVRAVGIIGAVPITYFADWSV